MTTFSQELFDRICERIADGESLRAICRDDDMPNASTVDGWLGKDEALAKQYARARERQGDGHFDRVCAIVDKVEDGQLEPGQARTMIDALKWTAGKLRPKVYGEKSALALTDGDGGPLQVVLKRYTDAPD